MSCSRWSQLRHVANLQGAYGRIHPSLGLGIGLGLGSGASGSVPSHCLNLIKGNGRQSVIVLGNVVMNPAFLHHCLHLSVVAVMCVACTSWIAVGVQQTSRTSPRHSTQARP